MKNILFLFIFIVSASSLRAQCLYTTTCLANEQVCDLTYNDENLWNASYWLDVNTQQHDLSDAPADLSAVAADTCAGATISAKYLLFLDLDGNDVVETVVKSWALPPAGTVMYNNINNPNYDGGEQRAFDQRPVPSDQLYRFALETELVGNSLTARLRWNNLAAPSVFVTPQLPIGKHRIEWVFEDNLSNEVPCNHNFTIKDCKKPFVVCLNGLAVNIMPTGMVQMWVSDFVQYGEDNHTPASQLTYAIRKTGTGSGFPEDALGNPLTNVVYDCTELGTQFVEVWVKDGAGNADYCETFVIVQDNANSCNGGGGNSVPVVICVSSSVNLDQNGTINVEVAEFIQAAYDDITPFNQLQFAIRKSGQGTGFPVDGLGNPITSLQFGVSELGTNLVEIWARDTDGNADYCLTYVLVSEGSNTGNAPTVVCLNGLSVNLMPTGLIQLWATDFLQYVEDDNTPSNFIELGIRKVSDGGTGFPESAPGVPNIMVQFSCNEQGTQEVELWARDVDGNTSFCTTYVLVQDNLNVCGGPGRIKQTICVQQWCDGASVSDVTLSVQSSANGVPQFNFQNINANGCYVMDSMFLSLPISNQLTVVPVKEDNPTNGVTPLDLVFIARHILGLEPLSTYAMIAADANRSNSITAFDIVESRKLIQGIYSELPNNTSWRFVDAAFVFPNPANPFQGILPEFVSVDTAGQLTTNFIAIKVGDVDCSATPGAAGNADDRQVQYLSMNDRQLSAGDVLDLPLSFDNAGAWLALQAGIWYNPQVLSIEAIVPGNLEGMDAQAFVSPEPGMLNLVWFATRAQQVQAGTIIGTLRVRVHQSAVLSNVLGLTQRTLETPRHLQAEAYDAAEKVSNLALVFRSQIAAAADVISPAQPNPTTGVAHVPVYLERASTVQLHVTDMQGKVVLHQQMMLPAGTHQLTIPAEQLREPGLYFWQVNTDTTRGNGKLIRL